MKGALLQPKLLTRTQIHNLNTRRLDNPLKGYLYTLSPDRRTKIHIASN